MDTTERLRCRCCGIASCDVGFTVEGDLLCDDCEQALAAHLGAGAWAGFLRERVARLEADEAEEAMRRARFVAAVGGAHAAGEGA